MSKHINLLSVKRAMSSKQLLSGAHQCSAAGSFLVCRSLRSVSCDHFLISTTLFHINSTDFLVHNAWKVIAAACPFKIFSVAFRTKKQEKNVWSSKGLKKTGSIPPCIMGSWVMCFRLSIRILWRPNFSSWDFVAPQLFNSECCGATKLLISKF